MNSIGVGNDGRSTIQSRDSRRQSCQNAEHLELKKFRDFVDEGLSQMDSTFDKFMLEQANREILIERRQSRDYYSRQLAMQRAEAERMQRQEALVNLQNGAWLTQSRNSMMNYMSAGTIKQHATRIAWLRNKRNADRVRPRSKRLIISKTK